MGHPVVAITGLRTFVGRRLAQRLPAQGVRTLGLDRRLLAKADLELEFHGTNLTHPTAGSDVAKILDAEEVDVVVHSAFRREPTADWEADHELETIGTLALLNACEAAGIKRIVLASSTMLYGPRPTNPNYLGEGAPLNGQPDAHCIRNRVEAEALVRDWSERHPLTEVTVLRTPWIFGPTFWDSVVKYFDGHYVPTALGYDPLFQFVHEEDALHAFEVATLEGRGGVFNVVGDGVLPLSTLIRVAGKQPLPLPSVLLDRFFPWSDSGDPPSAFFDYLRYLWVADGKLAGEAFGEPRYSTREAWMSFVSARRMARYR